MRVIADQDEYVGRFVAVDAIEVRARVSGYLEAIHFKDGQLVKRGDLLFTIDRRPFEASLAQTQANLAQARARSPFVRVVGFAMVPHTRNFPTRRTVPASPSICEHRVQRAEG